LALAIGYCLLHTESAAALTAEERALGLYVPIPLSGKPAGPLAFSADGRLLAVVSGGELAVWNLKGKRKLNGFDTPPGTPRFPRFSPDGRYLGIVIAVKKAGRAEGGPGLGSLLGPPDGGIVVLYDVRTGGEARRLAEHQQEIYCFCFSHDGTRLATASTDGTAVIWGVDSGKRLRTFEHGLPVRSVTLSPDGKLLASAAGWDDFTSLRRRLGEERKPAGPPVAVWRTTTGQRVRELGSPGSLASVKFSPDGRFLLVSSGVISLWDTKSWRRAQRFPPGSAAISPDGRVIAVEQSLWDVATGHKLARFPLPKGENTRFVEFSPDGQQLAVVTEGIRLLRVADVMENKATAAARPKAPTPPAGPALDPAVRAVLDRLDRYGGMQFYVWNSLTENAIGREGEDRVLSVLGALRGCGEGDTEGLQKLGGLQGAKRELQECLRSRDPMVRSSAATMIGLIGDNGMAPALASLLTQKVKVDVAKVIEQKIASRDPRWEGLDKDEIAEYLTEFYEFTEGRDRDAAAAALGLVGAREYAPRLAELVRRGDKARAGAAAGLGFMKAKEYASIVSRMLEIGEDDDPEAEGYVGAALGAIVAMGAREYAQRIARLLDEDLASFELNQSAAYALAELGAREHAKDIAQLLDSRFSRSEAAMALAILGASEYAPEIAAQLKVKEPLDRQNAALALGLMQAKEHAAQVAALLKDDECYVVSAAATSLLLMGADQYASSILLIVDHWGDGCISLSRDDLPSPEVYNRALARAEETLARIRRTRGAGTRPPAPR
jgi:WD40 repeat protein/HEAT repeat protein